MTINRRQMIAGGAAAVAAAGLMTDTARADLCHSKVAKETVILIAEIKAKPGNEEEVTKLLLSVVKPTHKEKGCIFYLPHRSKENPGTIIFYEHWSNQKTFEAHANSPHIKALMKKLEGKIESLNIDFLEPVT